MSVRIFGLPQSSYTWSCRMACQEKGVEHELVVSPPHTPEQLERHPFGKMPAFQHGDVVLFESLAIIRYVDEAFDGPSLQPKDVAARARMTQWMSAVADYLYDSAIRKLVVPRLVVQAGGGQVDEEALRANLPTLKKHLTVFDTALASTGWLAGDAFSAADIYLAPVVASLGFLNEGREQLAGLGALAAWLDRVQARPSFAATAPGK